MSSERSVVVTAVVPAYNAGSRILLTLQCLLAQALPQDVTLQIVVVNDGSTDDTASLLEAQAKASNDITIVTLVRDTMSCRARARNVGMAQIAGDYLLWLDATVCLPSGWLADALALLVNAETIVLGETLGLMPGAFWPFAPPTHPTPDDLPKLIDAVKALTAWQDPRGYYFELANPTLPRAILPWALGWTSVMLMPVPLATAVGGFDETFQGWGGEDVEFSWRLWETGASFCAVRNNPALHWPHEVDSPAARVKSMQANALRLFQKHKSMEVEIFLGIGHFAGPVRHRLEMLPLQMILPRYPANVISALRAQLAQTQSSILLGASPALARLVPTSDLLSVSSTNDRELRRALPTQAIHQAIGVRLPFASGSMDLAIVTDFWGGLSTSLKVCVASELARTAKRTVFICSSGEPTEASTALSWPPSHGATLSKLLQQLGLHELDRLTLGEHTLLTMAARNG